MVHNIILWVALFVVGSNQAESQQFPPAVDADDVEFFASTYDLDGLHWALEGGLDVFRVFVQHTFMIRHWHSL